MQLATAILVLLSHGGYWVGGQEQTIDVRWPVEQPMPDAVVLWKLTVANATVAEGQSPLPGKEGAATIKLTAPKVRAATTLQLSYRIVDAADAKKEMAAGTAAVYLAPDRLADLATVTAEHPMLVIDKPEGLPAALTAAGVKFDRQDDLTGLAMANQKLIVVGEDRFADDDPAAAAIQALARGGASVLVLRQASVNRVLQFETAQRDTAGYTIVADHPLLRHLPEGAAKSLLGRRERTILLPAGEAALELIHSPVEAETVRDAPVDALLFTQTLDSGRIVYCQLPLDRPAADARQNQLLVNLMEYARTRPQPTPSRAERQEKLAAEKKARATASPNNGE